MNDVKADGKKDEEDDDDDGGMGRVSETDKSNEGA